MTIDKIVVFVVGMVGIASTYWFFLMRKDQEVVAGNELKINVSGGFNPSKIILQKGKKTMLQFLRTDTNKCLEEVVFGDFKIRKFLPMDKEVVVELKPDKVGTFPFTCGMGMFHGKIIVK